MGQVITELEYALYCCWADRSGVPFASILSPLSGNFSVGSFSMPGWVWVVLPSIGIATAVLTLLFSRRKEKIGQEAKEYSTLDGEPRESMLNLYHKMVAVLVKKGLPSRQKNQPPYEYATIIYPKISDGQEIVEWLSQAASSAAYNPRPFSPSIIPEARRRLSTLRRVLVVNSMSSTQACGM